MEKIIIMEHPQVKAINDLTNEIIRGNFDDAEGIKGLRQAIDEWQELLRANEIKNLAESILCEYEADLNTVNDPIKACLILIRLIDLIKESEK